MKKNKDYENLTYHSIKKATGLGIGTISRFFNNGSISEKSRAKIQKYIVENNYEPNIGAKLIKGYENCVYLVICSIEEKSIIDITNSIVNTFKEMNINVYIVVSSYDHSEYLESLKKTVRRKPKTLILLSPLMNEELREYINNIKIDTYVFGDDSTNKKSFIIDDEKALEILTKKVIETKRYNEIIFIGKTINDPTTGKKRLEGFKKAIENSTLKNSYYLIENNNFNFLNKKINKKLLEKLSDNKTIIICGTHTIYKYLFFQKNKNNYKFNLTDIGYEDDFDYMKDSYQFKLFIDFYRIGVFLSKYNKYCSDWNCYRYEEFSIIEK